MAEPPRPPEELRRALAEAELLPPDERLAAMRALAAEVDELFRKVAAEGNQIAAAWVKVHRALLEVFPEANPLHERVARELAARTDWKLPEP